MKCDCYVSAKAHVVFNNLRDIATLKVTFSCPFREQHSHYQLLVVDHSSHFHIMWGLSVDSSHYHVVTYLVYSSHYHILW